MNARVIIALAALVTSSIAAAATEVPFLSGRVVDHAEILSAPMREQLTNSLKAH